MYENQHSFLIGLNFFVLLDSYDLFHRFILSLIVSVRKSIVPIFKGNNSTMNL